jgi:hypothetical protein
MRTITFAGLLGLLMAAGCASTKVTFNGPPDSVMFVDGKPYHLPASIEMSRPDSTSGYNRHDVSLVATVDNKELRAKGHIDVYGFTESDLDKLAVNTCNLDESQLVRIFDGSVLVFKGQSASRQPLYDLSLGKE